MVTVFQNVLMPYAGSRYKLCLSHIIVISHKTFYYVRVDMYKSSDVIVTNDVYINFVVINRDDTEYYNE